MRDPEPLMEYARRLTKKLCPRWFQECWKEEDAQEVLEKILESDRRNGEQRGHKSSFIYQKVLNARNKKAKDEGGRTDEDHYGDPARAGGADDGRIRSVEIGDAIRDCLSRLPPECQRAFTLREAGYSLKEIGFHLQCTEKSAENRVGYARRRLRICLERKGVNP